MVFAFGSAFNDYRPGPGYPGMPSDIGQKYERSYFNVAADVAQVTTVTVGTYAANATYMVSINGQNIDYTAPPTGGSLATVASALVEQINLYGVGAFAQSTGAAVFTITGSPGDPLTISASATSGGAITASTTTPVVTTGKVELGLAVIRIEGDTDREARLGAPDTDHIFLGVTTDCGYMIREPNAPIGQNASYQRGDMMLVREEGQCFVQIETDVNPSLPVFYRYTGTGKIGAFSGTTGTGLQQLLNARWVGSGKAGSYAELRLGCVVAATAS